MKKCDDIDIEILKEHFDYDATTGNLYWKKTIKKSLIGTLCGNTHKTRGYKTVFFLKRSIRQHRICWAIYHGKHPTMIDHINGIRSDNRIVNLREVTARENQQNRLCHRNGHLLGASSVHGKWLSSIWLNGKNVRLGLFSSKEEAHEKYKEALNEHLIKSTQ